MTEDEPLAERLFFIVGAPRSGTSLLQSILGGIDGVVIPPETEYFLFMTGEGDERIRVAELGRWLNSDAWGDQRLDEQEYRANLEQRGGTVRAGFLALVAMVAARSGGARVGEKSPHHCREVRRIRRIFPRARFIHVYRDPRDVVASRRRMPWSHGSHLAIAREWRRIIADQDRLRSELPTSDYLAVRYESLALDPEATVRQICAFLNEPFDAALLEPAGRGVSGFTEREAEWKRDSLGAISDRSIGRYRSALTMREIAGVQRETAPWLERMGYTLDAAPVSIRDRAIDLRDRCGDISQRWRRSLDKRWRAAVRLRD